jgi:acyl-coenzyme A thioesterase PaaI-like protein
MNARPISPQPPPEGFEPACPPGRYLERSAHFFVRKDPDAPAIGTWITEDQSNGYKVAHGGFLMTFADFAVTFILKGITINLSADFLRAVPVGSWLETTVVARRQSSSLIFVDTIATADTKEVLRISAILSPFQEVDSVRKRREF